MNKEDDKIIFDGRIIKLQKQIMRMKSDALNQTHTHSVS